jgi:hypothetical protein
MAWHSGNLMKFAAYRPTFLALTAIVAAFAAVPILPRETFFWLPNLVYLYAAGLALAARGRAPEWPIVTGAALGFAGIFVLVAQELIFNHGVPTRWLQWGRFPSGDAADFLADSMTLLAEGSFVSIRGRPLANAFIAGLWAHADFDLVVFGWAVAGFCAAATVIFAAVALRVFGIGAGAFIVAIALDFLHEHLGSASTEPVGFAAGLAAAGLLFSAVRTRSVPVFALGMFALAYAFMYRIGAVFVLPLLLLWPLFVPMVWRARFAAIAGGAVGILGAGMLHTFAVQKLTPDSPGFVNGPTSWYAVVAIGDEAMGVRPKGSVRRDARWVQIYDDNPGLAELPVREQGARFMAILKTAALERPLSLVAGAALELWDQLGRAKLFAFVDNKVLRWVALVFFLVGYGRAVHRARGDPLAAFLALLGTGLLASIPFLHGGENRVHAVLAGPLAALVVFGLAAPFGRRSVRASDDAPPHALIQLALPAAILAVTLGAIGFQIGRKPVAGAPPCADGLASNLDARPGSTVGFGIPSPPPRALIFRDAAAMREAIDQWIEIGARSRGIFYAPVDSEMLSRYRRWADSAATSASIVLLSDPASGRDALVELQDGVMRGCARLRFP